jgi:hypothetical protein
MSEEDLELLITLDNPEGAPEEDIFNHLQTNNVHYWLGQRFAARRWLDQRAEAVSNSHGDRN